MSSAFNNQILVEKLTKLNNSQQSIETLSHWCIFHRKKARQVVETWDKQFRELPKEQQVPFLYLANDILQNSRRRGGEFVNEFWRILPGALKDAMEKGGDHAHSVVLRLVEIWDERKVFGSRARTLREELLGSDPPPDLPHDSSKPSQSVKIKVPVGGIQEKLTSAYTSVYDVASDEDATLGRCSAAVIRIESLEKEWNALERSGMSQGGTTLADEIQEQQSILSHCIEQLEMNRMARTSLVSHLKDALKEQENKLDFIQARLQIVQPKADYFDTLGKRVSGSVSAVSEIAKQQGLRENGPDMLGEASMIQQPQTTSTEGGVPWQYVSAMPIMVDEPQKPKSAAAIAAEVAAKLAASASSAQVLQSVLSSLAAEEASSMRTANSPLEPHPGTFPPPDKRPRLVEAQTDHLAKPEGVVPNTHQHTQQHTPSLNNNTFASPPAQHPPMEQMLPPPPPFPRQQQYVGMSGNMEMQASYGRAGPILRPPPPPPPLSMQPQGHPAAGMPHMAMHPPNAGHGPYHPNMQPTPMRFYSQPPLPAPNLPRH